MARKFLGNDSVFFEFGGLSIDINHGVIQITEGDQEIFLVPITRDEAELMACALRKAVKYLLECRYE
jgi:hypothetical protein